MNEDRQDRGFDALYGEMVDQDPLAVGIGFEVKQRPDQDQVARVLEMRARGYFDKATEFENTGKGALAETYRAVCKELAWLSKSVREGKIDELEAKSGNPSVARQIINGRDGNQFEWTVGMSQN